VRFIINVVRRWFVLQYGPPKFGKVLFTVLLAQVPGFRGSGHRFLYDKEASRVIEATIRALELSHVLCAAKDEASVEIICRRFSCIFIRECRI
jgi:hypothetical protein